MTALTQSEMEAFLEKGWVAKLGTLLEDGSPYVNPVWYEWDGTYFWLLAKPLARFVENIKRDERIFLVVDKAEFPYVRVNVQGRAEVITEAWADEWVEMTRRMTVRYVGEQGLQYLEARLKYDLSVIRITPKKINTWKVTDFPPDRTFTTEAKWRAV
jgi:PPOX class probable F420-dependent enzyme